MAQAMITSFLVSYATTTYGLPRQVLLNALPIIYLQGGRCTIVSIPAPSDLSARLAVSTGPSVLTVDHRLAPEHRCPRPSPPNSG
jgi:acetyl esterase/lipase